LALGDDVHRVRGKAAVEAFGKTVDRSKLLTKDSTREMAETVLKSLGLGESCLGFTMVMLTNEFWREQVAAIPFHRRLMLLPHCLKNAEGCPADYDEFGLDCKKCGACSVADFKVRAEELGYKVLVSEGTPIVLKIIVSGHVDAIVGVACLNVLEKALDKILLAGVPVVATAVGGTPEVVHEGVNGYLVPPGDPAALARGIHDALADEPRRRVLGEQGRRIIREQFTFAAQARDYQRLFSLIRSPSRLRLSAKPQATRTADCG